MSPREQREAAGLRLEDMARERGMNIHDLSDMEISANAYLGILNGFLFDSVKHREPDAK